MKKIILALVILLTLGVKSFATTCAIPYENELTGNIIYSAHWNSNFQAISQCLNNQTLDGSTNIAIGGIQTTNIANLAITDAKIAGITIAGKVNGSALTALNNIPSGAGVIPTVNLGSGTANSSTVLFGNQTWGSSLPGPILSASNSGTQSLTSDTWTQRTFDTVNKDSGSYWSSNTYTPLVAGWYYVSYTDGIISSGAPEGLNGVAIYKDGSLFNQFQFVFPTGFTSSVVSGTSTAIVQMNGSTDYLQFFINCAVNGTAQGAGFSYVSIFRVF